MRDINFFDKKRKKMNKKLLIVSMIISLLSQVQAGGTPKGHNKTSQKYEDRDDQGTRMPSDEPSNIEELESLLGKLSLKESNKNRDKYKSNKNRDQDNFKDVEDQHMQDEDRMPYEIKGREHQLSALTINKSNRDRVHDKFEDREESILGKRIGKKIKIRGKTQAIEKKMIENKRKRDIKRDGKIKMKYEKI